MQFEAGLPPRDYYRRLAATLIVNGDLWDQFAARCQVMAKANTYGHNRWETVAATVLKGYSLGMGFMEALTKLRFINGNPVLRGPSAVAHIHAVVPESRCRCITTILRRSMAKDEYGGELPPNNTHNQTYTEIVQYLEKDTSLWNDDRLNEAEVSVWLMSRPGWDETTYIYTRAKAKDAGLLEGSYWTKFPERSLKWQTASTGTQEMFGDILEGLYLAEEFDHGPRAQAAQPELEQEDGHEAPVAGELAGLGDKMRALGVTYTQACYVFLGVSKEDASPPNAAQYRHLSKRMLYLEQMADVLHNDGTVEGYSIRSHGSSYDRFRPSVHFVAPGGDQKRSENKWAGSLRLSKDAARWHATRAAVQFLMGGTPEGEPPDEEPTQETRARCDAALEVETEKNAAVNKAAGAVVFDAVEGGDFNSMVAAVAQRAREEAELAIHDGDKTASDAEEMQRLGIVNPVILEEIKELRAADRAAQGGK